mgnify:CR=1 FL=1|tara:strand:+ start:808 stop:1098 length:291 start_codon:yes stop_codon:yes gene_type:complete
MKTIVLFTGALIAAACAVAEAPRETVKQSVSIGDVYNTESAQRAYDTLKVAATRACSPDAYGERMHSRRDTKRCIAEALDNGVESLNEPLVTALHD